MGRSGRIFVIVPLVACSLSGFVQSPDEKALVALARAAVESEVKGSSPPKPSSQTAPKPVFVTIEVGSRIIGCRGDLKVRTKSLEQEIVLAARAAAAHDPRYRPVQPSDLKSFQVTVTIVDRAEPITQVSGLTPEDGLVLQSGTKVGIVLPWEGKDPQTRLKWAYRKAGVAEGAPAKLLRLIAVRFRG